MNFLVSLDVGGFRSMEAEDHPEARIKAESMLHELANAFAVVTEGYVTACSWEIREVSAHEEEDVD